MRNKGLLLGLGALVLALVAGLFVISDDGGKKPTPSPTVAPPPEGAAPSRRLLHQASNPPPVAVDAAPGAEVVPDLPALAPYTLANVRGSLHARTIRCFGPVGMGPGPAAKPPKGNLKVVARLVAKDGAVALLDIKYERTGQVDGTVEACLRKGYDGFTMPMPQQPDGEQIFVSAIRIP